MAGALEPCAYCTHIHSVWIPGGTSALLCGMGIMLWVGVRFSIQRRNAVRAGAQPARWALRGRGVPLPGEPIACRRCSLGPDMSRLDAEGHTC